MARSAAAVSDGAPASSAAATAGSVARRPSTSTRPAYTPPSKGSARRSASSSPKRSRSSPPSATSPPGRPRERPVALGPRHGRPGGRQHAVEPGAARRHPQQRSGRQRDRAAPGPHGRRRAGRVHHLVGQAQLVEQRARLGAPPQERLGADVVGHAREVDGPQDAAEPVALFQHDDLGGRAEERPQPVRGGEPGDPAADDGDPHGVHGSGLTAPGRAPARPAASGRPGPSPAARRAPG